MDRSTAFSEGGGGRCGTDACNFEPGFSGGGGRSGASLVSEPFAHRPADRQPGGVLRRTTGGSAAPFYKLLSGEVRYLPMPALCDACTELHYCATRYPVLIYDTMLRACCAVSGTNLRYSVTGWLRGVRY
eukprot:3887294-Rhodomonas_salina.1